MSKDSPTFNRNDRQNQSVLAVILMLMVFSLSSVAYGLSSQISPAQPTSASPAFNAIANLTAKPAEQAAPPKQTNQPMKPESSKLQLPFSKPIAISIPSIKVGSDLIEVGKNLDGTIEVPSGENFDKAAWYKYGAAPGQIGSSVIEGHVDSADKGPSVFFTLGGVKPGESVIVDRADGKRVEFIIDRIEQFTKDEFPTEAVYGAKNYAGLTLITCGGDFDDETGEYESNILVTAHLNQVLDNDALASDDT